MVRNGRPGRRGTAAALFAAAALLTLTPDWKTIHAFIAHPVGWITRSGVDTTSATIASLALWLLALWTAAGLIVVTLSRLPGVFGHGCLQLARIVLPLWSRRYFAVLTGLTIALAPLEISVASAAIAPPVSIAKALPSASIATPATTKSASPDAPIWPMNDPQPPSDDEVIVKSGDSLWLISARRIAPPDGYSRAKPAEILAECNRWYAANTAVIGTSPDLIRPGQHLHTPSGSASVPQAQRSTGIRTSNK